MIRQAAAAGTGPSPTPLSSDQVDPRLRQAAEGMEAMFLDYMLKVMRQTVPKNEMDLESPATEIYRGMLDSEIARKAVRAGGIGLAEQIVAYLQPRSYTLYKDQGRQGAPPQDRPTGGRTGGTHEGQ